MEQLKNSNSGMLVIVRARPLTIKEISVNPIECLRALDSKMIAIVDSVE
jgi:hypothetical protein